MFNVLRKKYPLGSNPISKEFKFFTEFFELWFRLILFGMFSVLGIAIWIWGGWFVLWYLFSGEEEDHVCLVEIVYQIIHSLIKMIHRLNIIVNHGLRHKGGCNLLDYSFFFYDFSSLKMLSCHQLLTTYSYV